MSAKDYILRKSALLNRTYLAKKIKSKDVMSQDRRIITDSEVIGCFETYLRRYCEENKADTVVISNAEGKVIFSATLKDKTEE